LTGAELPNRDIHVSEKLLRENELLLTYLCNGLLRVAMEMHGVVDFDVREALEKLIRTYRTLESGVYYASRPANPLALAVYDGIQSAASEYREEEKKQLGMTRTRDTDVLGMLVFLQHFELDRNNGRKRGRAFIQTLSHFYAEMLPPTEADPGSSLVLP
jgi:hypothetical protein